MLEWAGEVSFIKVDRIRPTLPEYVLSARIDGDDMLSPVYVRKLIRTAYNFFRWLSTNQRGYRVIKKAWLDTLKPPRMTIEYKEHEAITLDEVRVIANAPVFSMRDRRIQAAAAFWFLSGIRVGAFVTLPLSAVDIENLTIKQWPKLGVHTKFSKHATTYLLNIPELLDVVRAWDREVHSVMPENGMWFAPGSPDTGEIDPSKTVPGKNSASRACKDLKEWLGRVDLPYYSPHKFRHGHAVYALKLAKDIAELKAVSQNLMHANLSITDGVYGILSEMDVKRQIESLTQKIENYENTSDLIFLTKQLLQKLEDGNYNGK